MVGLRASPIARATFALRVNANLVGRSIGKIIFGLRVVNLDGSRVRPRAALVRNLLRIIDVFFAFDGDVPRGDVLAVMAELRRRGISCDTDYAARSLKGQLTQAGRLHAATTVVVDAEGARVRREGAEERVAVADLLGTLGR